MKTSPCLSGPAVRAVWRAALRAAAIAACGLILSPPHRSLRSRHRHHPRERQGQHRRRRPRRHRHRHQRQYPAPAHTTTDEDGQYTLPLLPVGNYRVEVALTGFKNFVQTGILLEVGRNARVDATLEPGDVQEVVSVVADAPLVETNTAALSRTVGQNEVLEPAAGQPRPLLAAVDHRRHHQQQQLEFARRARAAHHHQRIAERADRQRQLPARWRQQHRRPARHRQPGAESRSGAGIPRHHQQLCRRIRPLSGRRRRRGHQVGHQPAPRRGVRVLPQREAELEALGASGRASRRRIRSTGSSTARRSAARSGRTSVLLRQLFRDCGRRRPTIATPRSCPRRSSAPATSRSRRSSRAIRARSCRSPATSSPPAASTRRR